MSLLDDIRRAQRGGYGPVRCDGYADGGQRLDFIAVENAAQANTRILDHPEMSHIFNFGSGRGQSFRDVAVAAGNASRAAVGQSALRRAGYDAPFFSAEEGTTPYVEHLLKI
jgi:ADP-L-glycero-D-manno-heptose 6-epimerase